MARHRSPGSGRAPMWVAAVLAAGGLLAAGWAEGFAPPAEGHPVGPTARYSTVSGWGGGYQGQIVISNPGAAPITGWSVWVRFPSGQRMTSLWSADSSGDTGMVVLGPDAQDAEIPPGGDIAVGFVATTTGTGTPADCSIDGAACAGLVIGPVRPTVRAAVRVE